MSAINTISLGTFPTIPQPAVATVPSQGGTIPATGIQASGAQPHHGGGGQAASPDQLQKVLDRMNQKLEGSGQSVRIGYASNVHQLTVEVVDNTTGQVVGQFPSKAMIEHEAAMQQFIGLMLSKEA